MLAGKRAEERRRERGLEHAGRVRDEGERADGALAQGSAAPGRREERLVPEVDAVEVSERERSARQPTDGSAEAQVVSHCRRG